MDPPPAEIGSPVDDIDTPALVVDLDALDRNIARMAEFACTAGIRVRPHAKIRKSVAIALRQTQKVGEAEALVRGGVNDVLVSNQVVGDRKLRRLAALAQDATIALS